MLLLSLLLGTSWATCTLDSVDSRARVEADGSSQRADEWRFVVEAGGCAGLPLPLAVDEPEMKLKIKIRHADDTGPRLGEERLRWAAAGLDALPAAWLELPELREGDLVKVRAKRRNAEGQPFRWDPTALGPVRYARLRLASELPALAWKGGIERVLTPLPPGNIDRVLGDLLPGGASAWGLVVPLADDAGARPSGPTGAAAAWDAPPERIVTVAGLGALASPEEVAGRGWGRPEEVAQLMVARGAAAGIPLQARAEASLTRDQRQVGEAAWVELSPPGGAEDSGLRVAPAEGSAMPPELLEIDRELLLHPGDPRKAWTDPRAGWTGHRVTRLLRVVDPAGADQLLTVPAGALLEGRQVTATLDGRPLSLPTRPDGWALVLPPDSRGAELRIESAWSTPGLVVEGLIRLDEGAPLGRARVSVGVEGGLASLVGGCEGCTVQTTVEGSLVVEVDALPSGAGTLTLPAALFSWRLAQVGAQEILPDFESLHSEVALYALIASMPEPALPVSFKNRRQAASALGDVLELARTLVRPGRLQGDSPLVPRKLLQVRRSGWGTPWELALLVTRYLRQLKLDALPVPLRPASEGTLVERVPSGFSEAVVWLRRAEGDLFLDPSCLQCAPGELRPALWGAQSWEPALAAMPMPPEGAETRLGHLRLQADGSLAGTLEVALRGPPALALREAVANLPPTERGPFVATTLGGTGAHLTAQEGVGGRGAPIKVGLTVEGARLSGLELVLPTVPAAGTQLWSSEQVHRSARIELEGVDGGCAALAVAAKATAGGPGIDWSRSCTEADGQVLIEEDLHLRAGSWDRAERAATLAEILDLRRASPPAPAEGER